MPIRCKRKFLRRISFWGRQNREYFVRDHCPWDNSHSWCSHSKQMGRSREIHFSCVASMLEPIRVRLMKIGALSLWNKNVLILWNCQGGVCTEYRVIFMYYGYNLFFKRSIGACLWIIWVFHGRMDFGQCMAPARGAGDKLLPGFAVMDQSNNILTAELRGCCADGVFWLRKKDDVAAGAGGQSCEWRGRRVYPVGVAARGKHNWKK